MQRGMGSLGIKHEISGGSFVVSSGISFTRLSSVRGLRG